MSAWFSVIEPEAGAERQALGRRLDGPGSDHQWLWTFFPGQPDAARDFLFRRHDDGARTHWYVVSRREPVCPHAFWRVKTRAYTPALEPGDRLHFEVRVNPTVATRDGSRAVRHDVVMAEKRRLLAARGLARWSDWTSPDRPPVQTVVDAMCGQWMQRQGERCGFTVDAAALVIGAYQRLRERRGAGRVALQFSTVDIAGSLMVVDAAAVQSVLLNGLGRAKAFGCGLMLVRRG